MRMENCTTCGQPHPCLCGPGLSPDAPAAQN